MQAEELRPGLTERGNARASGQSVIGDGGASWRLKALRRAQAQAAEEGKSLDSLVSERFGSLDALTYAEERSAHCETLHKNAIAARKILLGSSCLGQ